MSHEIENLEQMSDTQILHTQSDVLAKILGQQILEVDPGIHMMFMRIVAGYIYRMYNIALRNRAGIG